MKVFWVLGWDSYYPRRDNFVAAFDNFTDAQVFVDEQVTTDNYDNYEIVNIAHRL